MLVRLALPVCILSSACLDCGSHHHTTTPTASITPTTPQPEPSLQIRQPDPKLIARYNQLCEDLQRPEGRDPALPNGMLALKDCIAQFRQACADVLQDPKDRDDTDPLEDFTLVVDQSWRELPNKAESERNLAATLKVLKKLEEVGFWDKLAQAVAMPRTIRPLPIPGEPHGEEEDIFSGRLIQVLLPELGRFRSIARAANARMELARQAGDEAKFLATFDTSMRLADKCSRFPTMIDRLVGIAIASPSLEQARRYCLSGQATQAGLIALENSIAHLEPLPSYALALESERISLLDTADWIFNPDGTLNRSQLNLLGAGPIEGGQADKKATVELGNKVFDVFIARAEMPTYERLANPIPEELDLDSVLGDNMILSVFMPAMARVAIAHDHWRVGIRGARTMIALEKYRLAHGTYPESLAQLPPAPGLDGKNPWDFDPFSGKPLGYRLAQPDAEQGAANSPAAKAPYIIYSLGIDAEDNSGKEGKDRYEALRKKNGFDFVVSTN